MKNFIFKSDADFHKILFNKLDMMLTEQRHQRIDLSRLLSKINVIDNTIALQTQVDDYFDKDKEVIPEVDKELNNGSDSPR